MQEPGLTIVPFLTDTPHRHSRRQGILFVKVLCGQLHIADWQPHQVEGTQSSASAEDQGCAAKGVAGEPHKLPLVLQSHGRARVVCEDLQLLLDLLDVQLDRLWRRQEVLMELTAQDKGANFGQRERSSSSS